MNRQIFNTIEPSENLKVSILNRIQTEERKQALYRIVFSSAISLASVSTIVFFVNNIIKDAYTSGLSQYLSLLFSDGASVLSYWQSYLMSIIESLPIIPITITVASIWVFMWSVNSILEINNRIKFYKLNNI